MGDTHFRSNIKGKAGTETISDFTSITGTSVRASSYVKIGTHKYIFQGGYATEASIVAAATAVDASVKGSLYLGAGSLWIFDGDDAATLALTPT